MLRAVVLFSFLILLLPLCLAAQEIVSVTPTTVSVGAAVTVSGGPFAPDARILLGEREIVPSRQEVRLLVFTVPSLESGEYALAVKSGGRILPTSFFLRIIEPEPRIVAISPANIDECSTGADQRVSVSGASFRPGTHLMLDGAVIPADKISENEIIFTTPPLKGGLHHVQVVNPGDRKSLTFALFVNSIPEIFSVDQGADEVTSYELTIHGKNFLYNSTLVVDGTSINPSVVADGTQIFVPPAVQPQRDTVRYIDCNTLIYVRHPFTRQVKTVSLQVVNPGGQQSPVFHLSVP